MTELRMLTRAVVVLLVLVQGGCVARAAHQVPLNPGPVPAASDTPPTPVVVDSEESLWPDPVERTHVRLSSLQHRIEGYRSQAGRLPASLEEVFPDSAERRVLARDAWEETIAFRPLANDYELRSGGPDRVLETRDDLVATSTSEVPEFRRPPGQRTRVVLENLRIFATLYHAREHRLPERPEDLSAAGFDLYLGTVDEWRRPVVFVSTGGEFEVRSKGPDGVLDSADDVVVRGLHPALTAPR